MAKKITKTLKLEIIGAKAVPGQQLGPALGQAGIPIGDFVKRFNDDTASRAGEMVPVIITVFDDRTYTLTYKVSPVSYLVKKMLGIESGSGTNLSKKVGTLSKAQVKEIAEKKMPDFNAASLEAAMRTVEGTCRSMGVDVK